MLAEPQVFEDAHGEKWSFRITTAEIKTIRSDLGIDILEMSEAGSGMVERLYSDPVLFVDVLSILCQNQIVSRDLDEYQFAERLAGDTIEKATEAFIRAYVDFFPKARRDVLQKAMSIRAELQKKTIERAAKVLSTVTEAEIDKAIDTSFDQLGLRYTNMPASSE